MPMSTTPPSFPPPSGREGAGPRSRRQEARESRRKANLRFLFVIGVVGFIPAGIPLPGFGRLPASAPAPVAPRSAERPPYDNEPAEPAEGVPPFRVRGWLR